MQKKASRFLSLLGIGFFSLFIISGCKNDPASLGLETLPSEDLISAGVHLETISGKNINPERVISDSWGTTGASSILGYFNDPFFGLTKASFITELNLSSFPEDFRIDWQTGKRDSVKILPDSLVLNLSYSSANWYGDKADTLNIQVYELKERLSRPTNLRYYSNHVPVLGATPHLLADSNFAIKGSSTDSAWNQTHVDVFKIALNKEFTEKIFNLSEEQLANRDAFRDAINGLYVTIGDPVNPLKTGSLVRINLLSNASNLTLHYRKEIREVRDSGIFALDTLINKYVFPINTESVFINKFTHEHKESIVFNETNADRLYLQGMAGSYAEIDLTKEIVQWGDSLANNESSAQKLGISGVDLKFYADTIPYSGSSTIHTPKNEQLVIMQKDSEGRFIVPHFKDAEDNDIYAFLQNVATYDKETNCYKFRINNKYFEKAATGEIDLKPFYIMVSLPTDPKSTRVIATPQYTFRRVILFNNTSEKKPELLVKYMKYN
jgi:hypothetical protein